MSAVAELVGVGVVRGGKHLLRDVNWRIDEDQRWVIIGPNGAGKTTLLQILAAQLYPTEGMVDLLGEIVGAVDVFELRPRIGVTSAALAERLPRSEIVSDVVVSAAYAVSGRWREHYDALDHDRAQALLDQLNVGHLAQRTFGTLSEGERKRVQLARAMMSDPEMLLLDEPAAGLDLAGREGLLATLTELVEDPDSPAVVMVSHHMEDIPPGITHAMLLRQGEVVAAGPIQETVTSASLSDTFGLELRLARTAGGRFTAMAR